MSQVDSDPAWSATSPAEQARVGRTSSQSWPRSLEQRSGTSCCPRFEPVPLCSGDKRAGASPSSLSHQARLLGAESTPPCPRLPTLRSHRTATPRSRSSYASTRRRLPPKRPPRAAAIQCHRIRVTTANASATNRRSRIPPMRTPRVPGPRHPPTRSARPSHRCRPSPRRSPNRRPLERSSTAVTMPRLAPPTVRRPTPPMPSPLTFAPPDDPRQPVALVVRASLSRGSRSAT